MQTELFINQQKELFFTEMNLFIISLLQNQIEFLQEQLKSKDKIINSLIENLSRNNDVFFSQKATTLKAPENQTNYKQLQNTKTIDSKESQNINTPGCFCNTDKKSVKT